uniref:Ig-like domain-containing protein n=1 Tax=Cyprinodon variegatus TaxID=28743 RepID=A0A3Q2EGX5_CYPVA
GRCLAVYRVLFYYILQDSLVGAKREDDFGGSIDLNPGPISETIKSATWKHNNLQINIIHDVFIWILLPGRCDFDKTSGSLTINNLTLEDRGSYTPEINNKVLEKKELQVIISMKYNHEKTSCSLTCEAQVTADLEPVTYKWKTGDRELSTNKELLITTVRLQENTTLTCRWVDEFQRRSGI